MNTPQVAWHPLHLEALEKAFPECTSLDTTDELLYQRGQRSVLAHLRLLIEQQQKRAPS